VLEVHAHAQGDDVGPPWAAGRWRRRVGEGAARGESAAEQPLGERRRRGVLQVRDLLLEQPQQLRLIGRSVR
jgi:hypothetical protein